MRAFIQPVCGGGGFALFYNEGDLLAVAVTGVIFQDKGFDPFSGVIFQDKGFDPFSPFLSGKMSALIAFVRI